MSGLGVPIRPRLPDPLPPGGPGYGWKLSDEARRDIEAIERHMRLALRHLSGFVLSEGHSAVRSGKED